LDVDAREALVQALNAYEGAVVVVSHDRHLLELTADRLVLVADGMAQEFAGSLDDYRDSLLGRGREAATGNGARQDKRGNRKDERRAAAQARERTKELRESVRLAEAEMTRLGEQRSAIDRAVFDPANAEPPHRDRPMTELMKQRG